MVIQLSHPRKQKREQRRRGGAPLLQILNFARGHGVGLDPRILQLRQNIQLVDGARIQVAVPYGKHIEQHVPDGPTDLQRLLG
ncbi:hypothetical protein D3C73_1508640 [compost metagenome]